MSVGVDYCQLTVLPSTLAPYSSSTTTSTASHQSAYWTNSPSGIEQLAASDFVRFSDNSSSRSWFDPSKHLKIINDSDFPSLGVSWSPSGFGGAAGDASNNRNGTMAGLQSPVVPGQQAMLHNALFNRDASGSFLHSMSRTPYANLIRGDNSMSAASEFRIQNEDFPALPAATPQPGGQQNAVGQPMHAQQQQNNGASQNMKSMDQMSTDFMSTNSSSDPSRTFSSSTATTTAASNDQQQSTTSSEQHKQGIQTHPDGLVTNIPPNMLDDQFGMAGLLTFLHTIETDPNNVTLALGLDLTNLGLNLNSSKRNLYQTFGGPWADSPCRIQDLDVKVPEEYMTNASIRERLPNIKLNKLSDDVLFYLFYNCPGEVYQVAAASELYQRDWRFHKVDRVWLTRSPFSTQSREHTGSYEKSSFNVFDPVQWRKIPKEMVLEYKQLDGRPSALGAPVVPIATTNTSVANTPAMTTGNPVGTPAATVPPTTTPLGNGET